MRPRLAPFLHPTCHGKRQMEFRGVVDRVALEIAGSMPMMVIGMRFTSTLRPIIPGSRLNLLAQ